MYGLTRFNRPGPRTTLVRQITLVIVALVLGVGSAYAGGTSEQAEAGAGSGESAAFRASLVFVAGEVLVNGEVAVAGSSLRQTDVVETGAGFAEIVVGGSNVIRLDEDTRLEMNLGVADGNLGVERGSVAAIFDRVVELSSNRNVRMTGPAVVGGVRGTTVFMRVFDDGSTYFCTCNGTVHLAPQGAEGFTVAAPRHEAYLFEQIDGETRTTVQPDLYHTTAELNVLAERIGVTIPWGEVPSN